MSPRLAIGFLITEPPGKPHMFAYLPPVNCRQFLRQDSTLIISAPSTWPCCWHLVLLKRLSPGRAAKFRRETHPVADASHWALHAPSHLNPTRTTHLSLVLLSPLYRWRHWGKLCNLPKIKVLFISLLGSLLSQTDVGETVWHWENFKYHHKTGGYQLCWQWNSGLCVDIHALKI